MPGISRVWYVGVAGWLCCAGFRGLVAAGFGYRVWSRGLAIGCAGWCRGARGALLRGVGSTDCFSWVLREVGLAVGWRVRRSRTRRAEVARFLIWVRVFRTPGVAWG